MATVATLITKLGVETSAFTQGFTQARRQIDEFATAVQAGGQAVQGMGVALTAGVTVPLVAMAAASLKFSEALNKGMANVASLIPGATARILELRQGVQDLSPVVLKSTGDLTEGLYQVISAFGDTQDTMAILKTNSLAAAAGIATTTDAINLTSSVTKAWGDTSAKAVEQAADLALLTVRLGQTTFPDLAANMGKVIPLAQVLGVSLEELFGTFATFTGVTGGTAEVSTQLSSALRALMSPTADLQTLLKKLGYASGEAFIEARGLQGVFEEIVKAAEETGVPLQKFLGQAEAMTLILNAAGAQAQNFTDKTQAMANSMGTVTDAVREQQEGVASLGSSWDRIKFRMTGSLETMGQALGPFAEAVLRGMEPVLSAVEKAVKGFKDLPGPVQGFIITLATLAAAVGPVLVVVGTLIMAVGGLAAALAAASAAGVTLAGVGAVLLTISGVGLAIAAVVAILVYFRSELAAVGRALAGFAGDVADRFKYMVGSVKTFARPLLDALGFLAEDSSGMIAEKMAAEFKAGLTAAIPDMTKEMEALSKRMSDVLGAEPLKPPPPPDWVAYYGSQADTLTGLWDTLSAKGQLTGSGVQAALTSLHASVTKELLAQGGALTAERLQLENIMAKLEAIPNLSQAAFRAVIPKLEVNVARVTAKLARTDVAGVQKDLSQAQQGVVFWSNSVLESFAKLDPEVVKANRAFAAVALVDLAPLAKGAADTATAMANLAAAAEQTKLGKLGSTLGGLFSGVGDTIKNGMTSLWAKFGPQGVALAAIFDVVTSAMEPLQPVIDALREPLKIIGTLIGQNLAPILKLFVPIVEGVAKVFTFAQQAVGYFIQALGWLIDHLVPDFISKVGQGIEQYGKDMVANSKAARAAIGQELDAKVAAVESMNDLADAANKVSASMLNVPTIFKAAARAFEVRAPDVGTVNVGAAQAVGSSATVVHYHQYGPGAVQVDAKGKSAREVFKELEGETKRQNMISTGNSLGLR